MVKPAINLQSLRQLSVAQRQGFGSAKIDRTHSCRSRPNSLPNWIGALPNTMRIRTPRWTEQATLQLGAIEVLAIDVDGQGIGGISLRLHTDVERCSAEVGWDNARTG